LVAVEGALVAQRAELEAGEIVVDEWVAGIPHESGKKVKWGGRLILTNRRVIWEVTRLSRKGAFGVTAEGLVGMSPREVMREVASRAAASMVSRGIDATVAAILGDRSGVIIPLPAITAVRGDEERGGVLHVDTASGSLRLLVTASKWAYNAGADRTARDGAIARIRAACGIER
jgi:hypothetical protein